MSAQKACPECGAALAPGSPHGLCPKCLLLGQIGPPTQPCELEAAGPASAVIPSSSLSLEKAGDRIGRYKLLQQIGEGSCGVVYMAEQEEPIRRKVALKVIKLGMDTKQVIARFEAERQALALMDHPNIAKVLEAGATDTGRPYFVMELVYGIKITNYCDQNRLSTRERLDLFVQVCQAIQHAHQKGIIHRDIKPSNILVTLRDGVPVPKVIDFGIAKATTDQRLTDKTLFTQFAMFIGTPAYMSPEQAELSELGVDTRSDIYSLGILLYELLTGRTPFEAGELRRAGLDEIRRIIREQEPPRPSTLFSTMTAADLLDAAKHRHMEPSKLCGQIRGDLDWIVMKALEKDRRRRYETANGLAMDIQRHLNHEPVVARPPSTVYRVQKFVRRNKLAVTAAAIVASVLVLGICASTWEAVRAKRAEREQNRLRERAVSAQATAQAEASRAEQERMLARHSAYAANMLLAQADWDNNNFGNLLQVLTETTDYDERGFEWYYWQQQAHLALKTLRGHLGPVLAVAFSPDDQRIVTGSGDGTAKVWDAATGRPLYPLEGHSAGVKAVAFSADGQRIVCGCGDGLAKVWEVATSKHLLTIEGRGDWIRSAAFSPDGKQILLCSGDGTAKLWNASKSSIELLLTIPADPPHILSAAFSPDGQRIVTGSEHGKAEVWAAATGTKLFTKRVHSAPVLAVAFSPDGQRILTGSEDQTARVWDPLSDNTPLILRGHTAGIRSVAFSPDGQRIATAGADRVVTVWEATTGKPLFTLKGHSAMISSVSFSADSRRVLSGSHDRTAKVWDAENGDERLTIHEHRGSMSAIAFSPDSRLILAGIEDGAAKLWEAASGTEVLTFQGHGAGIRSVAFSPDGQRAVTGSQDQTAKVWETATGTNLVTLTGHGGAIYSVAFSPDGKKLVTGSIDQTARVWEVANGNRVLELTGHSDWIRCVAFSPDGQRIATGSDDHTAKVWDATSGTNLLTLIGHHGWINSLAFSPDGKWILTGSEDYTAKVWDAAAGTNLLTLHGYSDPITSVAFSPDGRRILTGGADQTVKIWESASGKELLSLKGAASGILSVAFSPDGRRIAASTQDQTVRVWEAASAAQVGTWCAEEQAAAELLAVQQHERTAAAERYRIQLSRDSGAIKEWLVLLPIPLAGTNEARALQEEQIDRENLLRPTAYERVKIGQGELVWRPVQLDDYMIDFNRLAGMMTAWSVAYAVCYIQSETARSGIVLMIGSDDQAKIYLNDHMVYERLRGRHYLADQDVVRNVELRAGVNVLIFKVVNQTGSWQGSVRLTAADGSPLKGIKTTLTP